MAQAWGQSWGLTQLRLCGVLVLGTRSCPPPAPLSERPDCPAGPLPAWVCGPCPLCGP